MILPWQVIRIIDIVYWLCTYFHFRKEPFYIFYIYVYRCIQLLSWVYCARDMFDRKHGRTSALAASFVFTIICVFFLWLSSWYAFVVDVPFSLLWKEFETCRVGFWRQELPLAGLMWLLQQLISVMNLRAVLASHVCFRYLQLLLSSRVVCCASSS